ncbi:MAG: sensor histidine kinase [Flavobacteriales bacterium]
MEKKWLYWLCQLSGWSILAGGNFINASAGGNIVPETIFFTFALLFIPFLITHTYRWVIHELGIRYWNPLKLVPLVLFSSVVMSFIFNGMVFGLQTLLFSDFQFDFKAVMTSWVLNFSIVFLLWNSFYFTFHYVRNLQRAEIKNLQLKAANTEIELSSFKNQMNPHFMFNSLNSIRALIDENPNEAKQGVTLLSGLLRNTLILSKHKTIALRQELELIEKYLSLEKIRYEERLQFQLDVDKNLLDYPVPPLIIQTLVENGIKHGISKLKEGGTIKLVAFMADESLEILITNSGQFKPIAKGEGIGIPNSITRLNLMYGDRGTLEISQLTSTQVQAKLRIPKDLKS